MHTNTARQETPTIGFERAPLEAVTPAAPTVSSDNPPAGCPYNLPSEGVQLDDVVKGLIEQALTRENGNQSAAARLLAEEARLWWMSAAPREPMMALHLSTSTALWEPVTALHLSMSAASREPMTALNRVAVPMGARARVLLPMGLMAIRVRVQQLTGVHRCLRDRVARRMAIDACWLALGQWIVCWRRPYYRHVPTRIGLCSSTFASQHARSRIRWPTRFVNKEHAPVPWTCFARVLRFSMMRAEVRMEKQLQAAFMNKPLPSLT